MATGDAVGWKSILNIPGLFDVQQRLSLYYLLSALGLALISYLMFRRAEGEDRPDTDKGFFAYVFSRDVYGHRSALQDYGFVAINLVIYYVVIEQLLISTDSCATVVHQLLITWFGPLKTAHLTTVPAKLAFTICSILAFDFALFWQHYLMHKIPILWHFHKVHHSAEVLTPVTLYRQHPLDLAFAAFVAAIFGGIVYGLFWYMTGKEPSAYLILGLNVVLFLFYLFGYNLRHSQIWFSYPAWLSHIFVSPAQHQVHHSVEVKHFDRNMGLIFAFWDKLFGTLYVPKKYEKLQYGINKRQPNPFNSIWDLYFLPVKWAWESLKDKKERDKLFPVVLFFGIVGLVFAHLSASFHSKMLPTLYTEDLTWEELYNAMHGGGIDSVIIPIGGTEENGPQMTTGKHNYIVRYTADQIARRIGHTVIAPVIAYVPEDDVSMRFPGTINVPAPVLEQVLISAADSFVAHGFKYVIFLGDHGGDIAPENDAAAALTKKWAEKGVKFIAVDQYYNQNNGQIAWLQSQGYTKDQIGTHAAIRDTSEMMFVHPDGIRPMHHDIHAEGTNGVPRLSSARIGEKLIELKVDAAVNQITPLFADHSPVAVETLQAPAVNSSVGGD